MPAHRRSSPLLLALVCLTLTACDNAGRFTHAEPGEALSAGAATVTVRDNNAFSQPLANLSAAHLADFTAAQTLLANPWSSGPHAGSGSIISTTACQDCHIRNGRGQPPQPGDASALSMQVLLSLPDEPAYAQEIAHLGVLPEPTYGLQLQPAQAGSSADASIAVEYSPVTITFNDGSQVQLRKPVLEINHLSKGPLAANTRLSARVAPPMIGLGLLEAIPEVDILANAGPRDDRTGTIAGRANWVWDATQQKTVLGRFGWKASQPDLSHQDLHSLSVTGPAENPAAPADCKQAPARCLSAATNPSQAGNDDLQRVLAYTRNLGVPGRTDVDSKDVLAGKNLFYRANCQACHVAQFTTRADAAQPELSHQVIHPYTDLLLHNMGDGLADNRSEFQAGGNDWRTPPLWGIGLTQTVSGHTQFLHDGRARNLMEAVLWHNGEALGAQREVLSFNAEQRAQLLAFLNSL